MHTGLTYRKICRWLVTTGDMSVSNVYHYGEWILGIFSFVFLLLCLQPPLPFFLLSGRGELIGTFSFIHQGQVDSSYVFMESNKAQQYFDKHFVIV